MDYRLILFLLSSTITGCISTPSHVQPTPAPARPEQLADDALKRGDFTQAASMYAALSLTGDTQAKYRLKSGLIYLDLADAARAYSLLTETPIPTETDTPLHALARGVIELEKSAAATSIALVNNLAPAQFDAYERGLHLRTLGKAQLLIRDSTAITNLLNAELFPLPQNRRTELTHLIWDGMRATAQPIPLALLDQRNPNLAGWLALIDDTRRSELSPQALADALVAWRLRFPAHPANEILIDEILEQAEEFSAPVTQVALILPFDGELGDYAGAIRDGFVAMRFAESNTKLAISMYSASGTQVRAAFDQAVKDGAQLIVGPLDKPGLESLLTYDQRKVPVLALNSTQPPGGAATTSTTTAARVTQFGLTPEDEAIDLANRAWRDGRRRMAIITPAHELGTRIGAAFKLEWERIGGVVTEESRYTGNATSYKAAIRSTFNLAQSEARAAALQRTLQRPLIFVARARADVDSLMLMAVPADARQIIPQFRYFGIDYLPIYSTSHVFAGGSSIRNDDDLDGIMFGTMPWLLNIGDESIRNTIKRRWSNRRTDYERFYAFGVDAYRLMTLVRDMLRQPGIVVSGATGHLSLDPSGQIRRKLSWAKYQGGVPRNLAD